MGKKILWMTLAAAMLASVGCVRHVGHHPHAMPPGQAKKVVAVVSHLDSEHHNTKVVVMHKKPHPRRHCWQHASHWHCHK